MDLFSQIFDVLMKQPRHFSDTETFDERRDRIVVMGHAINRSTRRAACTDEFALPGCKPIFGDQMLMAALLITKAKFESGLAEHVHEGHCDLMPAGQRCDADKQGVARAHGPWQQWRSSVFPASDWDDMNASTQAATDLAAWHATKLLSGGTRRCAQQYPDPISSTIAAFAGSCIRMTPAMVQRQAAATQKTLAQLFAAKPAS